MLPQAGSCHLAARSSTTWASVKRSCWQEGILVGKASIWLDFCLPGSGLNYMETKENLVPTGAGLPFFSWRFVTFMLLVGTCADTASVPHSPLTGFTSGYKPQVKKTRTKSRDKVWIYSWLNTFLWEEALLSTWAAFPDSVLYKYNQKRSSWKDS